LPRLFKSVTLIAWLIAGFLSFAARAADMNDRQIVADVVAGRYDKLTALEASAQRGDPTAMYWWSVLLDSCVIGKCRREEAVQWWSKAAQAGNSRSRLQVYHQHGNQATPQDPYAGLGPPRNAEEKLAWAGTILVTLGVDRMLEAKALGLLNEVDDAEPTMLSMHVKLALGRGDQIASARAMLAAGTPHEHLVAETLRRQYLLRERKRYSELLAMAQDKDAVAAVALCASTDVMEGHAELPPELYPLCVAGFERGHLGLAGVLLRHHMERQEMAVAATYARWCWSLPVSCGESLSEYERQRLGDSKAWRDRDAEIGIALGIPATEDIPLAARRRGLSLKVRHTEAIRACMRRAYLPEQGGFADIPECPWGKPPT